MATQLRSSYGVDSKGFLVDITDEKQVNENAKIIFNEYGKIDGLINNAANNPKVEDNDDNIFSRLENLPIDNWNQDIAVGLTGAFLCAKHYGVYIAKNPTGGSIVNISSDLGYLSMLFFRIKIISANAFTFGNCIEELECIIKRNELRNKKNRLIFLEKNRFKVY